MKDVRFERIMTVFSRAIDVPQSEQRAFVESECKNDPTLAADVLALLAQDGQTASLLDQDRAWLVQKLLGGPTPLPGTVGEYRILREIGRGGMGVVYLAEREDLERKVAVKVLCDASLSPARRERFAIEQRTLARLTHPLIARLYGAGVLPDGTPYFVMEYVEGETLIEYCRRNGCTLKQRLRLFRTVCEAVQYAHQQAVIHRDIKPSNILVTSDNGVKLLDFGIAKPLQQTEVAPSQSHTEPRLLTLAYAAPEHVRAESVDVSTDVYSLGVVLYELLTGTLPFDLRGLTAQEAKQRILETEPDRPSNRICTTTARAKMEGPENLFRRQAWSELDALCMKAMHKIPVQRYATVEALIRDVDHFLCQEPLQARPRTFTYRAGKFLQRRRHEAAVAATILSVVVGLVLYYTIELAEQRNRALTEAHKSELISEYLVSLFEATDPFAFDTDDLDVRMLLQNGVARAEALKGKPEVQALMLNVLGRLHVQFSRYEKADTLLRRALALRRAHGDPLDVAETLSNLGQLYIRLGELESAENVVREALALRGQHIEGQHTDIASSLDDLGLVLNRKGEYEQAETFYRLALRMLRNIDPTPYKALGSTLNNLGVNLFDQGDYSSAERYFRESLAVERTVLGRNHPSIAAGLANLGVLLETRGNFEAADSALTEALQITRDALGDEHYETAFRRSQLGGMLRRKGDYERAEYHLREALAVEEQVLGPHHRNTAVTLNHLALTRQEQGAYDEAELMLRWAADLFSNTVGVRHPYTAISSCHLAYVLYLQGKSKEAENIFRKSLAILEEELPVDHDMIALSSGKFGELLTAQERFAEAESLLVKSYRNLLSRFGADHRDVHVAAWRLTRLYERWEKPAKAAPYRRMAASARG